LQVLLNYTPCAFIKSAALQVIQSLHESADTTLG
jgi:hypothetical protein